MKWTELLHSEIEGVYKATNGLLDLVEDDKLDWKPATGDNWMTTGQLIRHIASACGGVSKGFVTGDWGMPEGTDMEGLSMEEMLPPASAMLPYDSVAEAREHLSKDKELALQMIAEAGEERLENEAAPAPWDPRPISLGQRILGMVYHLDLHKTQLFYYLKLQGKPVNTMSLFGM